MEGEVVVASLSPNVITEPRKPPETDNFGRNYEFHNSFEYILTAYRLLQAAKLVDAFRGRFPRPNVIYYFRAVIV
mgnify:FL=1